MNPPIKRVSFPQESIILSLIILFLLFWYGYSFTETLISPPSHEMSRELELSDMDYGFSKTVNYHVLTISPKDSELVTLLSVDGKELQIITLNIKGEAKDWITIDLDLSQASKITAAYLKPDIIRLFYKISSLFQVDIQVNTGFYSVKRIEETLSDFESDGSLLVFLNSDGLQYKHTAFDEDQIPISSGVIHSFKVVQSGKKLFVLSIHKNKWDTIDIHLTEINSDTGLFRDKIISENVPAKEYKYLKDTALGDPVLTALYASRDRKNKVNRMMIQKSDLNSGEITQENRVSVPLFNSKYKIIDSDTETTRFIYQKDTKKGVDLAVVTLGNDGSSSEILYTKTKSMSKLAGYFTLGEYKGIIFSDINYEKRALFFASNHPEIMKSTTTLSTIPLWYPLGTTLLLFLVSLIAGGLYLLALLPLPVFSAFLLDYFLRATHRRLYIIKTSLVTFLHTGMKLFLSSVLISSAGNFIFHPLYFGKTPHIYIILILSSLITYILALRVNKAQKETTNGCMSFYYRFCGMDYLLFVPLIIMYLISSILLSKI
ncbi:hypothetical protein [Oceanispirochaeta sp.]|jgi:hypothetical protein|uniref:hypothetical protein n=1 Tax=Oceanispirochaeta sp. TaxID=2035350 RepID=UPI0026384407|nr:hypothetical protein [Oceanispirochaeta sp.]MDA3958680.1 hypothetical protein [Oceanispirochaeta sp.]